MNRIENYKLRRFAKGRGDEITKPMTTLGLLTQFILDRTRKTKAENFYEPEDERAAEIRELILKGDSWSDKFKGDMMKILGVGLNLKIGVMPGIFKTGCLLVVEKNLTKDYQVNDMGLCLQGRDACWVPRKSANSAQSFAANFCELRCAEDHEVHAFIGANPSIISHLALTPTYGVMLLKEFEAFQHEPEAEKTNETPKSN